MFRSLAWRVAPGLMADRGVRWQFTHHPRAEAVGEVNGGPFAGLVYPDDIWTVAGARVKRLGTYELPLAEAVAEALEGARLFVDVGSAEGYYAVAAARRGIPVIAYESSSIQREAIRRLAEVNDVAVEVRSHCRRLPHLHPGSLVLMDVEGAEVDLLQPQRLIGSTAMVELHEQFVPKSTDLLLQRFQATHHAEILRGEPEVERWHPGEWVVFRPR